MKIGRGEERKSGRCNGGEQPKTKGRWTTDLLGSKVAAQKSHITYDDVVATLPQLDPEEQVELLQVLSKVLKKMF